MSFEEVAKQIIKNSVRSAVCIDDRYASAYTPYGNPDKLELKESEELYNSFRVDGCCDLDIFQFKSYEETWQKDHVKFNKDLLILDWELDPNNPDEKYLDSLKILKDVVDSYKIPFVVVYTNTEDLHAVDKKIIASFNHFDAANFKDLCNRANLQFKSISNSDEELDVESIFLDLKQDMYEYIFFYGKRDESSVKIINKLIVKLEIKDDCHEKFLLGFKKIFKSKNDNPDEILNLSIAVINNNSDTHTITRIEIDKHAYRINGTIVIIYHKKDNDDGVQPEKLFAEFASSIITNPYSFLNLLSLEFKDKLREDFSVIGTEFSRISESAFLFHLNNYRQMTGDKALDLKTIYDFILKSWISELYSQKINEKSLVLNFLQDRITDVNKTNPGAFNVEDPSVLHELIKYSSFVSNTVIKKREDFTLRFGDLFVSKTDEFFLCITPHCDCVLPKEKINDNFYFVKGFIQKNNVMALEKAESGYFSYIEFKGMPTSIEWKCKPFTSYVINNDINHLTITYSGKSHPLTHITILKENFAQRISNQSFGYGFRVGIDLPHIPPTIVSLPACEIV